MCAELHRSLDALGRKIDRHYAASGGASDLDRQHSYEPGTDHCDSFANPDVGLPKALQRDGTDRSQRRRSRGHLRGDVYREIARNKVDLGMVGVAATAASDAITRAELVHAVPHRNYFACAAISESRQCIQLCVHLL